MMQKIQVSIQSTTNPKIIKFELDSFITDHASYEFENIDHAKDSPLAQQLFYLPFVKKVYITAGFIAIERFDIVEWEDVQEEVASQIQDYLNSGEPVVVEKQTKKTPVTVYAESTPNPAVLKFVANKKLVPKMVEFHSIDEAKPSPLAFSLFNFPFVKSVFIDENYISVTKFDIASWEEITLELREFIRNFLAEGKQVLDQNYNQQIKKEEVRKETEFENLDDISKEIVNILEEYVKPAVASDGGNIRFESYDSASKKVRVILQGACSGCPSSTLTLKNGIETMLREMLNGKVETVEAING